MNRNVPMNLHYRKWLAAALLAVITVALIAVPSTHAQGAITLSQLSIQLWPEFDDTSMLVFYIGQVDGVTDQVDVTFTLPPGAAVNAVAYTDPASGGLLTAPSTVTGDQVTITSPNGSFHLEFYDPSLDTSSDQRTYSLEWPGTYAVKSLEWIVQEPPTAQNMAITPLTVSPQAGQFGLAYYGATQTDVAAGQSEQLVITYTKADALLTANSVQAAEPANSAPSAGSSTPPPAASSIDTRTVLIAVLVIVGIGAVGGGLYLYNRSQEEQPAPKQPRQRGGRKSTRAARSTARSSGAGQKFCTQCGTPVVDASDKFCRNCGASLAD
jgi:hypothetical protein